MFWKIRETARACNFNIYHNEAHGSLYMSTRNDVTIFFWSTANRINVFIFGSCSGPDYLTTVQQISERFKVLERLVEVLYFLLYNPIDMFAPRSRNVAQMDQMAIFVLLSRSSSTYECAHTHMGVHKPFRNKVAASIIYNGRSGMSVVAFRTAPQIGGLSCLLMLWLFPWYY